MHSIRRLAAHCLAALLWRAARGHSQPVPGYPEQLHLRRGDITLHRKKLLPRVKLRAQQKTKQGAPRTCRTPKSKPMAYRQDCAPLLRLCLCREPRRRPTPLRRLR
jgi:hypothetical protein